MEQPSRNQLLEEAAKKPIQKLIQLDVEQRVKEDDFPGADADGDSVVMCVTYELKMKREIRILIPENRTKEEIVRALQKALKSINRGFIDWAISEHVTPVEPLEITAISQFLRSNDFNPVGIN